VGTPWEIIHNPANDYVRRFVQARSQPQVNGAGAVRESTGAHDAAGVRRSVPRVS